MASDLDTTTGSIGWHRCHKNLLESNLHESYSNAVCSGYFGAAYSIWEIRTEIWLSQNFHLLGWETSLYLLHARAASFCSTCSTQGHQHKQFYSIDCINKFSVLTCPNLCRVDSALLARERKLAHMPYIVHAYHR